MIEAGERAAMAASVRGALAAVHGGDADSVLDTLGWRELLVEHPDDAIAVVFEALGATNATSTALDDVLARALGREPRAALAVALPPFAAWDAPGRIEGTAVGASGLATARAARERDLLVVCANGSGWSAVVMPLALATVRRVHGIDPDGGLHAIDVRGDGVSATRLDPVEWASAVALGRRALAHELLGACRSMLDLARTHALEREQFGRPVARFQAVRHRLADALVAVEALDATLTAAREAPGPETAALAKATAGRAARTVARHAQQVLAGVGFTAEHRFHRFLKRTMALEGLFGTTDAIALDVGRQLLATRRAPTLVEL